LALAAVLAGSIRTPPNLRVPGVAVLGDTDRDAHHVRWVMRRLDGLIDRYAEQLETRGLAAVTIGPRVTELRRFGDWLRARRPRPALEDVDAELVVKYIGTRSAFHARSTISGVVSNLRGLGEFLVEERIWCANPLRWIRGPKVDPRQHRTRRIDQEQLQALWGAAQARRQAHARSLCLAVLGILYGTGLRRGELERLELSDWDVEHGTLRIDGRKTGHARQVAIGEGVARCLEAYLPQRHNRLEQTQRLGERALLVNTRGERLSGVQLAKLIGRLCRDAGLPRLTPHQFRHSCASDLIAAGVALPDVQRLLGHAGIASTMRYVDIAAPERVAAMSQHPINRFLDDRDGERRVS
jgi:site-specific recombinase XerD